MKATEFITSKIQRLLKEHVFTSEDFITSNYH